MPWNVLILPLLGGYVATHTATRYRFRAQSLDGYRLLIESAIAGVLLLVVARIATLTVGAVFPGVAREFHLMFPEPDYIGTVFGLLIPFADNRRPRFDVRRRLLSAILRFPRVRWSFGRLAVRLRRAYRANRENARDSEIMLHGNALTRLLHEAGTSGVPISVSLRNRKWYVGYVAEAVNLEPKESHFRLLPLLSGYRDQGTLETKRVVYYEEVYERYDNADLDLSEFVVTLALADVSDARLFDRDVYADNFADAQAPPTIISARP